ncbi:MAG: nitrous oxide reductase family maturation protein NosD [Calditrichaeota bacterium]|nr:nitrous oxide reductase family maturation protein NosD [Calditrichota bacterium]
MKSPLPTLPLCLLLAWLLAPHSLWARVLLASPERGLGVTMAAALPGDTVRVAAGVYREDSVRVSCRLSLLAERGAVLDGIGGGHMLLVHADSVLITGLTLRNTTASYRSDYAAILAENCTGLEIRDCVLEQTFFGIYLARCTGARITGNRIEANFSSETLSGNGIHLWHCRAPRIAGNAIRGHRDGIYLEFVRQATIERNEGLHNLRYGLHFMFSDSCRYLDNTFSANGAGVAVMYSHAVDMSRNTFSANWGPASCGVLLKEITDSRLEDNLFEANTTGLHVEASNRLQAHGNRFVRNGWALRLMSNSTEGVYENNLFLANSFDVATNGRQNYSTFRGNRWDRYRGYDLDRDGFGDVGFRPVSVFSHVVQDQGPALILLRSLFVDLLDGAERAFPLLTPITLQDESPRMELQP